MPRGSSSWQRRGKRNCSRRQTGRRRMRRHLTTGAERHNHDHALHQAATDILKGNSQVFLRRVIIVTKYLESATFNPDLGLCLHCQKRRFAGAWKTDQRFLKRRSGFELGGSLVSFCNVLYVMYPFGVWRPKGRRFKSHYSRCVATLDKLLTRVDVTSALRGHCAVKFNFCDNLLLSIHTMTVKGRWSSCKRRSINERNKYLKKYRPTLVKLHIRGTSKWPCAEHQRDEWLCR